MNTPTFIVVMLVVFCVVAWIISVVHRRSRRSHRTGAGGIVPVTGYPLAVDGAGTGSAHHHGGDCGASGAHSGHSAGDAGAGFDGGGDGGGGH